MFCVALPASLLFLETPVEALLLIDVVADVFVAIKTEGRLRRFIEPLMAQGAVLFPLGMPLDDLAWHEGGFDGPCLCPSREKERHQDGDNCEDVPHAQGRDRHMRASLI